jgi:hypothetical protein
VTNVAPSLPHGKNSNVEICNQPITKETVSDGSCDPGAHARLYFELDRRRDIGKDLFDQDLALLIAWSLHAEGIYWL